MTDEQPADPNPDQPADAPGANASSDSTGPDAADDQQSGWSTASSDAGADPDSAGTKMINQLQSMIDSIATQAAPTARQIGIKAAELTAIAADRAGPIAHKAGDAAADVSGKLALRSREWAETMRRELGGSGNGSSDPSDGATDAGATDASSTATTVMDRPVDEIVDEVNRQENEGG